MPLGSVRDYTKVSTQPDTAQMVRYITKQISLLRQTVDSAVAEPLTFTNITITAADKGLIVMSHFYTSALTLHYEK